MTVRGIAAGTLATCSFSGLALIALGVLPWGVRAVALFTLIGFVWLFLLVVLLGVHFYERGISPTSSE